MKLNFELDEWQKEVMQAEGNLCINSGRQVGKSAISAVKVAEYIATNPNKKVLVISVTEDQAEMMLQKILIHLFDNHKNKISKGKDKPTKHLIKLTNKSEVRCKAVGQYGIGVLGMTLDILVVDEAAYMPEPIWQSVTPMLLTTGGSVWLISTPNAKEGYFYDAYTKPEMGFKTFHINSEEVAEQRPEPQRTIMLNYLRSEKARMTDLQYAQQYLAQFLEELRQLFPDQLIHKCQTAKRKTSPPDQKREEYFLGVDVARMGEDESTFEVLQKIQGYLIHCENKITQKTLTTETTKIVITMDQHYDFKKIYIDDGGLGVAVFDQLLQEDQTKRKVVPINNATRSIEKEATRRKKLLKEDLYLNLLRLMERGEIQLLDDPEIFLSLKSLMVEYSSTTNQIKIYGRYTHIAEGLIRAAWCVRENYLNPYIFFA